MSKFIPNSYQTPNAYVDEFLHLLTASEWKVLSYITRRTLGFQRRQDHIPTKQFVEGIELNDGTRYDWGVGLSRTAVLDALAGLVRYKFLIVVDEEDRTSQTANCYELQLDSDAIDREGLEARAQETYAKNLRKTRKASTKRGLSNGPQSEGSRQNAGSAIEATAVCPTDCGPSDGLTAVRPVDRHVEIQHENQIGDGDDGRSASQNQQSPSTQTNEHLDFGAYLRDKGMGAWRQFKDKIPYTVGVADFEARRREGQTIDHIVIVWRGKLPTEKDHYGLPRKTGQPDAADRSKRSPDDNRRNAPQRPAHAPIRPGGNPPPYIELTEEEKKAHRNRPALNIDMSSLSGRGSGDTSPR